MTAPDWEQTRGELAAEAEELRREVAGLRLETELFRLFAEESPEMIFVWDLEERRALYVNPRCEQVLGWSLAELAQPGFDFLRLIAPDSVERVLESSALHRRGEEHLPFEYAMLARDGRRLEVTMSSRLIDFRGRRALLGFITDITAQRRMAEQCRAAVVEAQEARARAESVIGAIGDSVIVQDRQWRIIYQNDVSKGLFGDRAGELCHRVFEGLDAVCPWCPVVETFRDGKVHRTTLKRVATAGQRSFELVSSPLLDATGRVAAGLKLVRDVTELVESAEELRSAKEGLERQNRELLALDRMKDGLIRDVSHELKTPVAKLAMQLELLRGQLSPACLGTVGRFLGVMEESVRRQQRVIRNLLDLGRLESGRRVFRLGPVRVDEVLARALEDYRPTLEAGGFEISCRIEPLEATADGEMLWHVFSNLVNNAAKFGRPGGGRRLEVAAAREEGRAVVRIADNGIGLAPEELAQVFDRFYQASASVEGSGVGLSICRSIMEGMGGTVTLESAGRGCGAVATVTLPLA